jgi:hypothetical protein
METMLQEDKYFIASECAETGAILWMQQQQESLTFSWLQNIFLQWPHTSFSVCIFIEAIIHDHLPLFLCGPLQGHSIILNHFC